MLSISPRKFVSVLLAAVMAYEAIGMPLAHARQQDEIWSQRRQAAALTKHKQLASLTPQNVLQQLPSIKAALPTNKWTNAGVAFPNVPASLRSLIEAVPASVAS